METYTEFDLKNVMGFKNAINLVNKEQKDKEMFSIEYLLINHSCSEVIQMLRDSNETYNILIEDFEIAGFFESYFEYVKKYYESIMIKEGSADHIADRYFDKLKEPSSIIFSKSNIGFIQSDVIKSLMLMKEAIKAYYDVYYNRELIAELRKDDSENIEHLDFILKEQELLHLLGVTSSQLKNNPDFIRLTGNKNMTNDQILDWIMRDIDGNNDLLQYNEDFLKSIIESKGFKIVQEQYSPETTTQLLNYGKIRAKSQIFLKYGPWEKVSLVSKLADNKSLSRYAKSNIVMISKAETFRKYPWAYFGQVRNADSKYIETLQLDSSAGKRDLLKGSRPAIVTDVHIIGDSGQGGSDVHFSEEEQMDLIIDAYDSFSSQLDFEGLIRYFEMIKNNSYKYGNSNSRSK